MKKDTVSNWLRKQKDLTSKEKNEALRTAKLTALHQCEDWLFARTWAQMRAPVQAKREAIAVEGLPLLTKQKQNPASLTEDEATRLNALTASDEVYEMFENKITPTAFQAELEAKSRQREQARRATLRQRGKER